MKSLDDYMNELDFTRPNRYLLDVFKGTGIPDSFGITVPLMQQSKESKKKWLGKYMNRNRAMARMMR